MISRRRQLASLLVVPFVTLALAGAVARAAEKTPAQKSGPALRSSDPRFQSLPDIRHFLTNRSDRFIVDFADTSDGHPFRGKRAQNPHGGAHIYFDNTRRAWPKGPDEPASYPPIYAPLDGVIANITPTFRLNNGADRYGIDLAFARDTNGGVYKLCYSIEPFIPEPSPGFYLPFMTVSVGQKVKKGEIIGRMYVPAGQQNTHIHFNLMKLDGRSGFIAPAIFTPEVVAQFHERCRTSRRGRDGDREVPACLGYMLAPEENPFGTGAANTL